jgi:hypothetical protein
VDFISSELMVADVLTKALAKSQHQKFLMVMGLMGCSSEKLRAHLRVEQCPAQGQC